MPRPFILLVGPPHPCSVLANRLVERGVNTVQKLDGPRAAEWLYLAGRADVLLLVGADAAARGRLSSALGLRAGPPPRICECALQPSEGELQALLQKLGGRADG